MVKGRVLMEKNKVIHNATFALSKAKNFQGIDIKTEIRGEFFNTSFFNFSNRDSTKIISTENGFIFVKFFHYENNVLKKIWTEVFKVDTLSSHHIITEKNERNEYFDLNWTENRYFLKDEFGIVEDFV